MLPTVRTQDGKGVKSSARRDEREYFGTASMTGRRVKELPVVWKGEKKQKT